MPSKRVVFETENDLISTVPIWRKTVALFLLAFGVACVSIPGFCSDAISVSSSLHGTHNVSSSVGIGGDIDGDCWCCCAHIVPMTHFDLGIRFLVVADSAISAPRSLSGDIPTHFQPPRS